MVRKKVEGMVIDDLKESDLPEVVAIETVSFTMPWSEALFYNEIHNPGSILKVAKVNGRIAGYICANQVIDEGHILNLAVHPEFREAGIASSLVEYVIRHLRENNCRFIFLEVRISNETAKRMYEKFDFEVIGTRKNYYLSPIEDAVIMVLKLEE